MTNCLVDTVADSTIVGVVIVPCEWCVAGTPSRVLKIGAQTIVSSVLPWTAFYVGQEWRADLPDQRFGCVYQWQTFFYVFVAKAVSETNKKSCCVRSR